MRYFPNPYPDFDPSHVTQNDPQIYLQKAKDISNFIISNFNYVEQSNLDGGLYVGPSGNDGRDAFLAMSSAYYDRTCLKSAVNFEQKIYFCLSRSSYYCGCARKFT